MTKSEQQDVWASGVSYEPYIGRWSRLVAREFLLWLAFPPQACWLDVGCGTGALSQTILEATSPQSVRGVDASEEYIALARNRSGTHVQRFSRETHRPSLSSQTPMMPSSLDSCSILFLNPAKC